MGNRMLYVRKDDETFWDRAQALAAERGFDSMSTFVTSLVRREVLGISSAAPSPADLLRQALAALESEEELRR